MNPSRVLAAGLVSAAALVASAPAALATEEPNTGITVVLTGDDHYVAADDVVVRQNPTEQSAVVEIAHHGDVFTVHDPRIPDVDAGRDDARRWLEAGNRRTGAHGYVQRGRLPAESARSTAEHPGAGQGPAGHGAVEGGAAVSAVEGPSGVGRAPVGEGASAAEGAGSAGVPGGRVPAVEGAGPAKVRE
ncbi:hypothetical protein [Embleya scabrispora]|uniref:hypothetical protein n=1 Tax=Embleya scabrispora TaxID=159449 RepID=UPI0003771794|nr:hypothetical protein [Embleya scabrispora]MYS87537.1 hypothetical protein [Streptomyces sp. SID5474]